MTAKVAVTTVAVVTTKFLLHMCHCTVDSDVGTGDFSLSTRAIARVWTRRSAIARVSGHGLGWYSQNLATRL